WFSARGNGICHQVHAERFAAPGRTLAGADSHTCTAGGLGVLALGLTATAVAAVLAAGTHPMVRPEVLGVRVSGALPEWVGGKDVALELLRRLTVRGACGAVLEFQGEGVEAIPIHARLTIANMAAELRALPPLFPPD